MAKNQGVNAKNIQFDRHGAGIEGYGITPSNLNAKLTKLYVARAQEDGGSKSIWDAMVKNTGKSLARSPDSLTAQQFDQFLKTGKLPAKPTAGFQKYAAESLDYGLRETGRAQQHKPTSFLSGLLTDLLPEIALGMVPGVGPGLAAAYGGIKGGIENGLVGGLTGALGGYGAGSTGAGLFNAGANAGGIGALIDNPAQWAGNFGSNIVNGVKGTFDSFGNFIAHPIDSITGGGTLNNVNQFMPGDIASRAGTNVAGGVASGVSRALNAGSGGKSILDHVIDAAGVVTPILGGIQASKAAEKAANTQLAYGNAAIAEGRRQYEQNRKDLAPWRDAGGRSLNALEVGLGTRPGKNSGYLMKDFSLKDFQADPSYEFRRNEGLRGINNSAAARGMQLSGATLKALNRYNSDLASQEYGDAFNRDAANKNRKFNYLSGVAGTGQTAATTGASLGAANSANTQNTLTNMGNAQAAGYVGSNNAMTGGFQDALGYYQNQQLMNRLFPQYSATGNAPAYAPRYNALTVVP